MPVEGPNLPMVAAGADAAQAMQNVLLQQERVQGRQAAAESQDAGKREAVDQVQITQGVEDKTIEGESRGAHSFELKKDQEEKKEEPPAEEKPPDPGGRGAHLDIEL